MKILSIWQPWASLVAHGQKKWETRAWSTDYRGPLLIHAAKYKGRDAEPSLEVVNYLLPAGLPGFHDLPRGCLLALVQLVACKSTGPALYPPEWLSELSVAERARGNFSPNRFAWRLELTKRFDVPIPWQGAQGLRDAPYSLRREVEGVVRV